MFDLNTNTETEETGAPIPVISKDLFAEVRPYGWLGAALENISNPRKHRWKKYLRACKLIPKESPVSGSTSFEAINNRRICMIDHAFHAGTEADLNSNAEFRAIQRATDAWLCGPMVAANFLAGRLLRKLEQVIK